MVNIHQIATDPVVETIHKVLVPTFLRLYGMDPVVVMIHQFPMDQVVCQDPQNGCTQGTALVSYGPCRCQDAQVSYEFSRSQDTSQLASDPSVVKIHELRVLKALP